MRQAAVCRKPGSRADHLTLLFERPRTINLHRSLQFVRWGARARGSDEKDSFRAVIPPDRLPHRQEGWVVVSVELFGARSVRHLRLGTWRHRMGHTRTFAKCTECTRSTHKRWTDLLLSDLKNEYQTLLARQMASPTDQVKAKGEGRAQEN